MHSFINESEHCAHAFDQSAAHIAGLLIVLPASVPCALMFMYECSSAVKCLASTFTAATSRQRTPIRKAK